MTIKEFLEKIDEEYVRENPYESFQAIKLLGKELYHAIDYIETLHKKLFLANVMIEGNDS